jgi:hypothetical protein
MTQVTNSIPARVDNADHVKTWREIQAIVNRINVSEGKSEISRHPRPRRNKTNIDQESGSWGRRFENQQARANFQNGVDKIFPTHTCNGHRYYRGTKIKTKVTGNGKNVRARA